MKEKEVWGVKREGESNNSFGRLEEIFGHSKTMNDWKN